MSYSQIGLASDGSYVWTASSTALTVWSPTGSVVTSHAGNYATASIFAAPSELRIALGPAGSSVIEYLAVPSGADTVSSAFSGTFNTWFVDGTGFLTNVSTNVWVYAKDASQLELVALSSLPSSSNLGGLGNYFWAWSPIGTIPFNLYRIGNGNTPVAQYGDPTALIPSPVGTIGLVSAPATVSMINLGAQVTATTVSVPGAYNTAFAIDSGGRWSVGNEVGVLYYQGTVADPSATGLLGCGQVFDLAGSDTGTAAVATATGVLVYDTSSGTLIQEIPNFVSKHVELSSDGTVLATTDGAYGAQYLPWFDLNIYSLPNLSILGSWPSSSAYQADFRLARGGTRIGRTVGGACDPTLTNTSCTRHVTDLSGSVDVLDDTGYNPTPRVSPSGAYIALTDVERTPWSSTQIYQNSTLVSAVAGSAIGWIDDNRLLVQSYVSSHGLNVYDHSTIYSNSGAVVASPSLPEIRNFYTVSSSQILSRTDSQIYDVTSGALVWTPGSPFPGAALAGPFVIYARSGGVVTLTTH